jgi:hypothetical protein
MDSVSSSNVTVASNQVDENVAALESRSLQVLKENIEIRMKNLNSKDAPVKYEISYRKKWKELQEQLVQDIQDEDHHYSKRLEDERDSEKQGEIRFEERKRQLQKKIQDLQTAKGELETKLVSMSEKCKLITPPLVNPSPVDSAVAIKVLVKMLRDTQKELKIRSAGRASECICCNSNLRDELLLPCRHFVVCHECSARVTTCPVCRTGIVERIRVLNS